MDQRQADRDRAPRPLRVAVVGVGERGAIARFFNGPKSSLVAAVDSSQRGRARAREMFGDQIDVLEDVHSLHGLGIDAALVATPDDAHARIAIELLSAGIAVYLEKPLAITVAEADLVLQAALHSGTKLYVGHNFRQTAVASLMKEIIDRGEIGEVKSIWCRHFVGHGGDYYFKDWHADRSRSNGLLLQKGAHDIDLIHWLAGSYSREVVGMGDLMIYGDIHDRTDRSDERLGDWFSTENWPPLNQRGLNPVVDVEDLSMVMMRLESGVLASYQQCHFTPDYWRNYTVIGTEGRLENFGDSAGGTVRVWRHRTGYAPEGDAVYEIGEDAIGHETADSRCVAEFVEFVRSGRATTASALGARNAVAAAAAATKSLRSGSVLTAVTPPDADTIEYFESNQTRSPVPS